MMIYRKGPFNKNIPAENIINENMNDSCRDILFYFIPYLGFISNSSHVPAATG